MLILKQNVMFRQLVKGYKPNFNLINIISISSASTSATNTSQPCLVEIMSIANLQWQISFEGNVMQTRLCFLFT